MCGISHARVFFLSGCLLSWALTFILFCFVDKCGIFPLVWARTYPAALTPPSSAILAHIHAHQILKICSLGLARSICSGIVVASNTQTPAGQTQSKRVQQHMDAMVGGWGDLIFSLIQFWGARVQSWFMYWSPISCERVKYDREIICFCLCPS